MCTSRSVLAFVASFVFSAAAIADPQYQIYDIGVVQGGDTASQCFGASTGGVGVGRSFRSGGTQAFRWTLGGGIVGLPNLSGRNFCLSNSANDSGTVVGTGATTAFGSGRLPLVWRNGVVSQLPLPSGETLGDANQVNASGIAVGSVNAGSLQRGAVYSGESASVITQTTADGSYFVTAFGINNSGRIVGQGIDPNNAARNVGMVYDMGSQEAFEVGALDGFNGALAFGVSNNGFVVGASMLNQGPSLPFIRQFFGIRPIPLPAGTSQGSARAVNTRGWAVGTASSSFAIPFLYDGSQTYRLADLIPANSGWDLATNTSSSARGINDHGLIVGTGVFNGATHAYAMAPTLQIRSAASRKYHGTFPAPPFGPFDIPLPLTGPAGVECRSSGPEGFHSVVFEFTNFIASASAAVTTGTGSVSGSPSSGGTSVQVDLIGVVDVQTLGLTLSNVTDVFGQVLPDITLNARFLIGDVNGSGTVNSSDIGGTKAQVGNFVSAENFRADINVNGPINASDVGQVKANAGRVVP